MGKIVAANWKMYKPKSEISAFINTLRESHHRTQLSSLIIFPPLPLLHSAIAVAKDLPLRFGAQNVHWSDEGAFTGEVSAGMLSDMGFTHVLVGHSERRALFHESDEVVNRKVHAVLRAGLRAIVCIGESQASRKCNIVEQILQSQLGAVLAGIPIEHLGQILIAYEPTWAIGTGEAASPTQILDAHTVIRNSLCARYGAETAERMPILYGGSVTKKEAPAILEFECVGGLLVGRASLDAESLGAILGCLVSEAPDEI